MGRLILTLPRLGETMQEAKVTEWLVAPGTAFKRGDVLLEVETDKTVVEVPALADGVLLAHLVAPGETVALDQPIAEVESDAAAPPPVAAPPPLAAVTPLAEPQTTQGVRPTASPRPTSGPRPAASPAARAAARRQGVDLTLVQGTGRRGRIMAADIGSDGPQIVLLHGLFDDHRGWRDLPRRLQAGGLPVLALDLPGHGSCPAAADFDAALDHVAAALPAGNLRLVGHSLGAALAVRLALRLGARVEALILSAPAGLGARMNADFVDGMLAAQTPAALSRALALLDAGPLSPPMLAAELQRIIALRPGHQALAAAILQNGFQQIDITADLARLTCPVTVLFGTGDRILDWHDVAHLPATCAIHLIHGAGHLPHLQAPDLTTRLILGAHARRNAQA